LLQQCRIAEYLNKEYKEDQFVNIVKSHESNQPNMNSTSKTRLQKNETNQMKTVKQKIKAYDAQSQD
jgi:hypothetical protein